MLWNAHLVTTITSSTLGQRIERTDKDRKKKKKKLTTTILAFASHASKMFLNNHDNSENGISVALLVE